MSKDKRQDYGAGSIYQRADGKWIGAYKAGLTANGKRKRVTVVGRTEAEAKRRLRARAAEIDAGEVTESPNITVKVWADKWLKIKERRLSPKGYAAVRGPVAKWIVPTIGHRRLKQLAPQDVRAVEDAQRDAGLKGSTCAATQRVLFNMLRKAIAEGHAVPTRVLMAEMPNVGESDRRPLSISESLAVLIEAGRLDHGTRWAVALLCGMRQGECLGLTWDAIDFEGSQIIVRWQLQRLPYIDKRDRSKGFRVPNDYTCRQVHKAWHLVRPKSKAGFREYPLPPGMIDALRSWRAIAPDSPHGLVWPDARGLPRDHGDDLAEWHALQQQAGVRHPDGRYYHVHECRNVTATQLREVGADGLTITSMLGHTSLSTSEGYMRVTADAKRAAMEKVAGVLGLG